MWFSPASEVEKGVLSLLLLCGLFVEKSRVKHDDTRYKI